MTAVSPIDSGYTYEYNYTLPKYGSNGEFKVIVYANDTLGYQISSNSTFVVYELFNPSGWLYRRPITIDNTQNPNTLTDYQVLVTLDTATLISYGKMNSDCSDIRFSYPNPDGTEAEIPYWIESDCNTPNTKIWVKVPSIPANGYATIYVYYGNPNATSLSNDTNVFIFSTFAERDQLNTWNVYDGDGTGTNNEIYYDSTNKRIVIKASGSGGASIYAKTTFPFETGFVWEANATVLYDRAFPAPRFGLGISSSYPPSGTYPWGAGNEQAKFYQVSNVLDKVIYAVVVGGTEYNSGQQAFDQNNHIFKITSTPSGTYFYIDNNLKWSTTYYPNNNTLIPFHGMDGASISNVQYQYIYWVRVRKYTSPEPIAILGEEETIAPIHISKIVTYDNNLNQKIIFFSEDIVRIRANVTHDNGTSYIDKVLITIIDPNNNIVVNNESMTAVSPIDNGYTYEYNYTLPKYVSEGTWKVIVYANDTLGNSILGRTEFNVIQRFYPTGWQYRVPIKIIENLGRDRVNYVFWVNLTIPAGHVTNCTKEIRVTQGYPENTYSVEAESIVPSRVIREGNGYCEIEFVGNVSANSFRIFYVYYGNPNAQEVTYDFNNSQFFVDYGDAPCSGYMRSGWGYDYLGGGDVDYINETHVWIGGGYTTQGSTNNCIALFDLTTRSYQIYNLPWGGVIKVYADENISILAMDDMASGGNENAIYVFRDDSWQFLARAETDFGTGHWGGIHDIVCFPAGTQYECHFVKGWEDSYVRFLTDKYSKTLIDIIHLPFSVHPEDVKPFEHNKFWVSGQQCFSTQGFWVVRCNNGVFDVNRYINRNYAGQCPGGIFDMVCFDFDHCFGAGDYTVWLITPENHIDLLPRIDVDKSICWNEGGYINCWTYQPVKLKNRNIVWFGYHASNDYVGWSGTKWIMYDYDENRFNQYGYLKDANGNPVYIYEIRRNSVDILNETEGMAIGRSVDPISGTVIRPAVWLVRSQSMEIGAEETITPTAPPPAPPYTEVSSCMQIIN
jgi:hypothetical protein